MIPYTHDMLHSQIFVFLISIAYKNQTEMEQSQSVDRLMIPRVHENKSNRIKLNILRTTPYSFYGIYGCKLSSSAHPLRANHYYGQIISTNKNKNVNGYNA